MLSSLDKTHTQFTLQIESLLASLEHNKLVCSQATTYYLNTKRVYGLDCKVFKYVSIHTILVH